MSFILASLVRSLHFQLVKIYLDDSRLELIVFSKRCLHFVSFVCLSGAHFVFIDAGCAACILNCSCITFFIGRLFVPGNSCVRFSVFSLAISCLDLFHMWLYF